MLLHVNLARHLKLCYISFFTNFLQTDNEIKIVKTIYSQMNSIRMKGQRLDSKKYKNSIK